MRQVLFLQGAGEDVHEQWDARLVDSLRRALGPGFDVRYPRLPDEHDPHVATWRPAIERALDALDAGAVVVGHSLGGTFLIPTLAERDATATLSAIVLVAAPFVGEGGWPSDELRLPTDLGARLPTDVPVLVYHGEADDIAPVAHADLWAAAIPQARVHRLAGRDHQLGDDLREVASEIVRLTAT